MNDLRNAEGSGGRSGVSERSAREGNTQSAPAAWAGLRGHAHGCTGASESCALEQNDHDREERPELRRARKEGTLDLVGWLGELDGRRRCGRGREVRAVDIEDLEQDERAYEPDTDDIGHQPQEIGR